MSSKFTVNRGDEFDFACVCVLVSVGVWDGQDRTLIRVRHSVSKRRSQVAKAWILF